MLPWPVISSAIGWLYTSAWSFSFYPQLLLNYKRKSVTGLSMDYLVLNVVGFLCYSTYTVCFLTSETLQDEYRQRNPTSRGPAVRVNDAVFALHALAVSSFTLGQANLFGYERASSQRVSLMTKVFVLISALITTSMVGSAIYGLLQWIDVMYEISYIKLLVSLGKLLPQLWLNYKRKSTEGWSIVNVLLDFTGGLLSLLQLLLDCAVNDDWSAVTGNGVKTGLGLFSILFNISFITQHYVLYRRDRPSVGDTGPIAPDENDRLLAAGLRS